MSSVDLPGLHIVAICRADSDAAELDDLRKEVHLTVARTADEYRAALPGSRILFLNDVRSSLVSEVGIGAVEWIHTSGVGVDALLTRDVLDRSPTVTVSRGVCERPIAEYVLATLLLFLKDLPQTIAHQQQRQWAHRDTRSLHGRNVIVLGTGPVGAEIVSLLRAAGVAVEAFARTTRVQTGLGKVHGFDDLAAWLPWADDVVLALPLNASTRGVFDSTMLNRMRSGGMLVNVGRGPVVDETALIEAITDGKISAAVLDVFATEPLPHDHPFWGMPNVLVSPHMSGDLVGWRSGVVSIFRSNLLRWVHGQELAFTVDLESHPVEEEIDAVCHGSA